MSEGTRRVTGQGRGRTRAAFVIAQVGVATVLLAGAGLFLRSFQEIQRVDLGMDLDDVLVARVELPMGRYSDVDQVMEFHRSVLAELRASPGIMAAGVVSDVLFRRFPDGRITPEGREGEKFEIGTPLMVDMVTPGFAEAMGMTLLRGRALTETDESVAGQPSTVLINEAAARLFWPNQDAVGKRFQWGTYRPDKSWKTVVGVLADARRGALHETPIPQMFSLGTEWNMSYVVRVSGTDPLAGVPAIREAVRSVDPTLPFSWISAGPGLVGEGLTLWRLRSLTAALAGGLVALLAVLGMYGLLNDAVARHRYDIGLRIALGAVPARVRNGYIGRGVLLASGGLAVGLVGVAAMSRLLGTFLFGVAALDVITLTAITLLIGSLALVASWIPAQRATRVDPARCLSAD